MVVLRIDSLFSTKPTDDRLPCDLLKAIADSIPSQEQSVRLAIKLKLPDHEVIAMMAQPILMFTSALPHDILINWSCGQTANVAGPILYDALCDMERPDIAERFQEELLGKGKMPNEPYSVAAKAVQSFQSHCSW